MDEPILDERERGIVRRFAQRYLDHQEDIEYEAFEEEFRLNAHEHLRLVNRLKDKGLIASGIADGDIRVLPRCVELVRLWDAPPPMRDRWDEATKWFRSKWWSLPLLALAVGVPAIKGWIDFVATVLGWVKKP